MESVAPPLELQPHSNKINIRVSLMEQGGGQHNKEGVVPGPPDEGKCSLLGPHTGSYPGGLYDKPLSCFGCGIGWLFFILGFAFPLLWYYATVLYFRNYYLKDPRERAGLAASAIAALICSVAVVISLLAVFC